MNKIESQIISKDELEMGLEKIELILMKIC